MTDFYALHNSVHNTYQRYGRMSDDIKLKYMDDRRNAIERTRASSAAKTTRVKKPAAGSTAAPGKAAAPQRQLPADQHAAALRQKYGKGGKSSGGSSGGDKLVYSASQAAHKAAAKATTNFGQKGYNQPDLHRNAPGGFAPPHPSPVWSSSQKGHNQPSLTRSTSHYGTSPYHTPGASLNSGSTPARPSMRKVWEEGVAHVQARRIEQDTRMAQSRRESRPSGEGWLASTGHAMLRRADQIGTERAVRSRTFGQGATSHSTGHGRRAF